MFELDHSNGLQCLDEERCTFLKTEFGLSFKFGLTTQHVTTFLNGQRGVDSNLHFMVVSMSVTSPNEELITVRRCLLSQECLQCLSVSCKCFKLSI